MRSCMTHVAGLLERSNRLQSKVSSLRRQAQVTDSLTTVYAVHRTTPAVQNVTPRSQYAHADVVAAGVQVKSVIRENSDHTCPGITTSFHASAMFLLSPFHRYSTG